MATTTDETTVPMRAPMRGYVMLHKPSNGWHPGHSTLRVFFDETDAMDAYAEYQGWDRDKATWVPVEVEIREVSR